MATKLYAFALVSALLLASILAGCITPATEAPLITSSKTYVITQGQTEKFRVSLNSSTPEYSIRADYVLNRTALLTINPGSIPVGLTEGDYSPVDLNKDGAAEIVIYLENTTGQDAYIAIHVAGASPVCTAECPLGQVQSAYPDCSCHITVRDCPSQCPSGKLQRPYPDCSCYSENRTCTDGTLYGQCSPNKPKICETGALVERCPSCGCPTSKSCNFTSGACYTPVAAATPTPGPGPTATPTPAATATPGANEQDNAIILANQTAEGQLMARFDTLYKKNPSCSQAEFISTFTAKKGRAPNTGELTAYTGTKSYIPRSVTVSATRNGTSYDVLYVHSGTVNLNALKVVVSSSVVISKEWLDTTSTDQNAQILSKAESIVGNCGLIMAFNGWV